MTFARVDSWHVNLRIYARLIGLLRPHWTSALGAVLCLALSTGFALAVPWLLAWVIDVGIRQGRPRDLLGEEQSLASGTGGARGVAR